MEPYIYIRATPDSLYTSFITLSVTIYPNHKISRCSVILSSKFNIINAETEGGKIETISPRVAVIRFSVNEDVINFKLKIEGALEDSGDVNFPLISAKLQVAFLLEIEPEAPYNVRVQIYFPKDCKGYINYSSIRVGDQKYTFDKREYRLNHVTDGYPETIVSYYTPSIKRSQSSVKIEMETYYRPSFLLFLPSLLFPSMLGLPIVAIWAYPGLEYIQRVLFMIPIFSIIFTIWYKTAPVGMVRLPCLLNHIYVFWTLVWVSYAVAFEIFKIRVSTISFFPYLLLMIATLLELYYFYRHPTQKSKPCIVRLNEIISPWEKTIGEKFIDNLVKLKSRF